MVIFFSQKQKRNSSYVRFCQNVPGFFSRSEENARFLFLLLDLQRRPGGRLKDLPNSLLRLGRAFEVSKSVNLLGHGAAVLGLDRLLLHLGQLLDGVGIVSQILKQKERLKNLLLAGATGGSHTVQKC